MKYLRGKIVLVWLVADSAECNIKMTGPMREALQEPALLLSGTLILVWYLATSLDVFIQFAL